MTFFALIHLLRRFLPFLLGCLLLLAPIVVIVVDGQTTGNSSSSSSCFTGDASGHIGIGFSSSLTNMTVGDLPLHFNFENYLRYQNASSSSSAAPPPPLVVEASIPTALHARRFLVVGSLRRNISQTSASVTSSPFLLSLYETFNTFQGAEGHCQSASTVLQHPIRTDMRRGGADRVLRIGAAVTTQCRGGGRGAGGRGGDVCNGSTNATGGDGICSFYFLADRSPTVIVAAASDGDPLLLPPSRDDFAGASGIGANTNTSSVGRIARHVMSAAECDRLSNSIDGAASGEVGEAGEDAEGIAGAAFRNAQSWLSPSYSSTADDDVIIASAFTSILAAGVPASVRAAAASNKKEEASVDERLNGSWSGMAYSSLPFSRAPIYSYLFSMGDPADYSPDDEAIDEDLWLLPLPPPPADSMSVVLDYLFWLGDYTEQFTALFQNSQHGSRHNSEDRSSSFQNFIISGDVFDPHATAPRGESSLTTTSEEEEEEENLNSDSDAHHTSVFPPIRTHYGGFLVPHGQGGVSGNTFLRSIYGYTHARVGFGAALDAACHLGDSFSYFSYFVPANASLLTDIIGGLQIAKDSSPEPPIAARWESDIVEGLGKGWLNPRRAGPAMCGAFETVDEAHLACDDRDDCMGFTTVAEKRNVTFSSSTNNTSTANASVNIGREIPQCLILFHKTMALAKAAIDAAAAAPAFTFSKHSDPSFSPLSPAEAPLAHGSHAIISLEYDRVFYAKPDNINQPQKCRFDAYLGGRISISVEQSTMYSSSVTIKINGRLAGFCGGDPSDRASNTRDFANGQRGLDDACGTYFVCFAGQIPEYSMIEVYRTPLSQMYAAGSSPSLEQRHRYRRGTACEYSLSVLVETIAFTGSALSTSTFEQPPFVVGYNTPFRIATSAYAPPASSASRISMYELSSVIDVPQSIFVYRAVEASLSVVQNGFDCELYSLRNGGERACPKSVVSFGAIAVSSEGSHLSMPATLTVPPPSPTLASTEEEELSLQQQQQQQCGTRETFGHLQRVRHQSCGGRSKGFWPENRPGESGYCLSSTDFATELFCDAPMNFERVWSNRTNNLTLCGSSSSPPSSPLLPTFTGFLQVTANTRAMSSWASAWEQSDPNSESCGSKNGFFATLFSTNEELWRILSYGIEGPPVPVYPLREASTTAMPTVDVNAFASFLLAPADASDELLRRLMSLDMFFPEEARGTVSSVSRYFLTPLMQIRGVGVGGGGSAASGANGGFSHYFDRAQPIQVGDGLFYNFSTDVTMGSSSASASKKITGSSSTAAARNPLMMMAYYAPWEGIYGEWSLPQMYLHRNSSQVCIIDYIVDDEYTTGKAYCTFYIPQYSTRVKVSAAQIDFATNSMVVEVSALGMDVTSWRYCGGHSQKFKNMGGLQDQCDLFYDCVDEYLFDDPELDTYFASNNGFGVVTVTVPVQMNPRSCGAKAIIVATFSSNIPDTEGFETGGGLPFGGGEAEVPSNFSAIFTGCDPKTEFECEKERRCISASAVCDGIQDCFYNGDEAACDGWKVLPSTGFCFGRNANTIVNQHLNYLEETFFGLPPQVLYDNNSHADFYPKPSNAVAGTSSSSSGVDDDDANRLLLPPAMNLTAYFGTPDDGVFYYDGVASFEECRRIAIIKAAHIDSEAYQFTYRAPPSCSTSTFSSSSTFLGGDDDLRGIGVGNGACIVYTTAATILLLTAADGYYCNLTSAVVDASASSSVSLPIFETYVKMAFPTIFNVCHRNLQCNGRGESISSMVDGVRTEETICVCECDDGYSGNDCSKYLSLEESIGIIVTLPITTEMSMVDTDYNFGIVEEALKLNSQRVVIVCAYEGVASLPPHMAEPLLTKRLSWSRASRREEGDTTSGAGGNVTANTSAYLATGGDSSYVVGSSPLSLAEDPLIVTFSCFVNAYALAFEGVAEREHYSLLSAYSRADNGAAAADSSSSSSKNTLLNVINTAIGASSSMGALSSSDSFANSDAGLTSIELQSSLASATSNTRTQRHTRCTHDAFVDEYLCEVGGGGGATVSASSSKSNGGEAGKTSSSSSSSSVFDRLEVSFTVNSPIIGATIRLLNRRVRLTGGSLRAPSSSSSSSGDGGATPQQSKTSSSSSLGFASTFAADNSSFVTNVTVNCRAAAATHRQLCFRSACLLDISSSGVPEEEEEVEVEEKTDGSSSSGSETDGSSPSSSPSSSPEGLVTYVIISNIVRAGLGYNGLCPTESVRIVTHQSFGNAPLGPTTRTSTNTTTTAVHVRVVNPQQQQEAVSGDDTFAGRSGSMRNSSSSVRSFDTAAESSSSMPTTTMITTTTTTTTRTTTASSLFPYATSSYMSATATANTEAFTTNKDYGPFLAAGIVIFIVGTLVSWTCAACCGVRYSRQKREANACVEYSFMSRGEAAKTRLLVNLAFERALESTEGDEDGGKTADSTAAAAEKKSKKKASSIDGGDAANNVLVASPPVPAIHDTYSSSSLRLCGKKVRSDRCAVGFGVLGLLCAVVASFLVIYYATGVGQESNFMVLYEEYSDPLCAEAMFSYMPTRMFAIPFDNSADSCQRIEVLGEAVGTVFATGQCVGANGRYSVEGFKLGSSKPSCQGYAIPLGSSLLSSTASSADASVSSSRRNTVPSGKCVHISEVTSSPSSSTTSSSSTSSTSDRNVYVLIRCGPKEFVNNRISTIRSFVADKDDRFEFASGSQAPSAEASLSKPITTLGAPPLSLDSGDDGASSSVSSVIYVQKFVSDFAVRTSTSYEANVLNSQARPVVDYDYNDNPLRIVMQSPQCSMRSSSSSSSAGGNSSSSLSASEVGESTTTADCILSSIEDSILYDTALGMADLRGTPARPWGASPSNVAAVAVVGDGLSPSLPDVPIGFVYNGFGLASSSTSSSSSSSADGDGADEESADSLATQQLLQQQQFYAAQQRTWTSAGSEAHRYYGAAGTIFDMGLLFPRVRGDRYRALYHSSSSSSSSVDPNPTSVVFDDPPEDDEGYTVSMWLRADERTQGFAYAVCDSFEDTVTRRNHVLHRLGGIITGGRGGSAWYHRYDTAASSSSSSSSTRVAPYSVYQSLFVNGPGRSLVFAYASPPTASSSNAGDLSDEEIAKLESESVHLLEYDLVGIGMDRVFNGHWHHIAITFLVENGRVRAQLTVDGESSYTKSGWSVCVTDYPRPISTHFTRSARVPVYNKVTDVVTNEGVVVTGYFNGGVYNLRATVAPLLNTDFLHAGTEMMRRNSEFPRTDTLILGVILILVAILGLVFLAVRGFGTLKLSLTQSSTFEGRAIAELYYSMMASAVNDVRQMNAHQHQPYRYSYFNNNNNTNHNNGRDPDDDSYSPFDGSASMDALLQQHQQHHGRKQSTATATSAAAATEGLPTFAAAAKRSGSINNTSAAAQRVPPMGLMGLSSDDGGGGAATDASHGGGGYIHHASSGSGAPHRHHTHNYDHNHHVAIVAGSGGHTTRTGSVATTAAYSAAATTAQYRRQFRKTAKKEGFGFGYGNGPHISSPTFVVPPSSFSSSHQFGGGGGGDDDGEASLTAASVVSSSLPQQYPPRNRHNYLYRSLHYEPILIIDDDDAVGEHSATNKKKRKKRSIWGATASEMRRATKHNGSSAPQEGTMHGAVGGNCDALIVGLVDDSCDARHGPSVEVPPTTVVTAATASQQHQQQQKENQQHQQQRILRLTPLRFAAALRWSGLTVAEFGAVLTELKAQVPSAICPESLLLSLLKMKTDDYSLMTFTLSQWNAVVEEDARRHAKRSWLSKAISQVTHLEFGGADADAGEMAVDFFTKKEVQKAAADGAAFASSSSPSASSPSPPPPKGSDAATEIRLCGVDLFALRFGLHDEAAFFERIKQKALRRKYKRRIERMARRRERRRLRAEAEAAAATGNNNAAEEAAAVVAASTKAVGILSSEANDGDADNNNAADGARVAATAAKAGGALSSSHPHPRHHHLGLHHKQSRTLKKRNNKTSSVGSAVVGVGTWHQHGGGAGSTMMRRRGGGPLLLSDLGDTTTTSDEEEDDDDSNSSDTDSGSSEEESAGAADGEEGEGEYRHPHGPHHHISLGNGNGNGPSTATVTVTVTPTTADADLQQRMQQLSRLLPAHLLQRGSGGGRGGGNALAAGLPPPRGVGGGRQRHHATFNIIGASSNSTNRKVALPIAAHPSMSSSRHHQNNVSVAPRSSTEANGVGILNPNLLLLNPSARRKQQQQQQQQPSAAAPTAAAAAATTGDASSSTIHLPEQPSSSAAKDAEAMLPREVTGTTAAPSEAEADDLVAVAAGGAEDTSTDVDAVGCDGGAAADMDGAIYDDDAAAHLVVGGLPTVYACGIDGDGGGLAGGGDGTVLLYSPTDGSPTSGGDGDTSEEYYDYHNDGGQYQYQQQQHQFQKYGSGGGPLSAGGGGGFGAPARLRGQGIGIGGNGGTVKAFTGGASGGGTTTSIVAATSASSIPSSSLLQSATNAFAPLFAAFQSIYLWSTSIEFPKIYDEYFAKIFSFISVDFVNVFSGLGTLITPLIQLFVGLIIIGFIFYYMYEDNKRFERVLSQYVWRRDELEETVEGKSMAALDRLPPHLSAALVDPRVPDRLLTVEALPIRAARQIDLFAGKIKNLRKNAQHRQKQKKKSISDAENNNINDDTADILSSPTNKNAAPLATANNNEDAGCRRDDSSKASIIDYASLKSIVVSTGMGGGGGGSFASSASTTGSANGDLTSGQPQQFLTVTRGKKVKGELECTEGAVADAVNPILAAAAATILSSSAATTAVVPATAGGGGGGDLPLGRRRRADGSNADGDNNNADDDEEELIVVTHRHHNDDGDEANGGGNADAAGGADDGDDVRIVPKSRTANNNTINTNDTATAPAPATTTTRPLRVAGVCCQRHKNCRLSAQTQTQIWPFANPPSCALIVNGVLCGEQCGVIFSCGLEYRDEESGELLVCNYALCERHCRIDSSAKSLLVAAVVGFTRRVQSSGFSWLMCALLVLMCNLAYTPFMKTALMILGCHPFYQCEFDHCWDDMDQKFALAVFCCLAVVILFGIGFPAGLFFILRQRKKALHVAFVAPEYEGRYLSQEEADWARRRRTGGGRSSIQRSLLSRVAAIPSVVYRRVFGGDDEEDDDAYQLSSSAVVSEHEWFRFVSSDATALAQQYQQVFYRWMFFPAITILLKIFALFPAIFIEPRSFEQRLGCGIVQLFVTAFVFATDSQISPIVLLTLRVAEVHNLLALGLQNISLVVLNDHNVDIGLVMIVVTILYVLFSISVFILTVIYPVLLSVYKKYMLSGFLERLRLDYSEGISLYLNPFSVNASVPSDDEDEDEDADEDEDDAKKSFDGPSSSVIVVGGDGDGAPTFINNTAQLKSTNGQAASPAHNEEEANVDDGDSGGVPLPPPMSAFGGVSVVPMVSAVDEVRGGSSIRVGVRGGGGTMADEHEASALSFNGGVRRGRFGRDSALGGAMPEEGRGAIGSGGSLVNILNNNNSTNSSAHYCHHNRNDDEGTSSLHAAQQHAPPLPYPPNYQQQHQQLHSGSDLLLNHGRPLYHHHHQQQAHHPAAATLSGLIPLSSHVDVGGSSSGVFLPPPPLLPPSFFASPLRSGGDGDDANAQYSSSLHHQQHQQQQQQRHIRHNNLQKRQQRQQHPTARAAMVMVAGGDGEGGDGGCLDGDDGDGSEGAVLDDSVQQREEAPHFYSSAIVPPLVVATTGGGGGTAAATAAEEEIILDMLLGGGRGDADVVVGATAAAMDTEIHGGGDAK